MAAISTTTPSIANALAQLISGGSSDTSTPTATGGNSAASSAPSSQSNSGPAAFVTLSDQAKAAVAARAQSDRAAADNLQAYVEAHHVNPADIGTKTDEVGSLESLLGGGTQGTDAQAANPPSTSSVAKVEAIVAQITSLADANEPQPFQSFTPTESLSNSVTVDGYTLTLDTNASTQNYGIQLSGDGVEAFNQHFGPSDGAGGVSGVTPGVTISIGDPNNNEAEDEITVTQNIATESSASISSPAGSAAASVVNAQSSSITFLVNYATGQISAQESELSVSAQATWTGPGSTLSTLA